MLPNLSTYTKIDNSSKKKGQVLPKTKTLSHYLNKIAILGGYMNRTSDPPPGNIVMWRGLSRLTDMKLGLNIGLKMTCGGSVQITVSR